MVSSALFCPTCGAANLPSATICISCNSTLQSAGKLQPGTTGELAVQSLLQQRYRILAKLGSGGFAAVYKAADIRLGDRLVAVKEMSQSGLKPQELHEAIEAFRHEAMLLAGLMHPNLPRIYDHFEERGRWYLVMDFIEGQTLEERLDGLPGCRMPIAEVLAIGIQLCNVLHYLHTRQPPIIFRDLKPANIMLTADNTLYLIDFGIARHFKPGQAMDTIAFGSPGYAAPEQYGKAQTTARADIFSLGVTLHELLTGDDPSESPFTFAPLPPDVAQLQPLISQMVNLDVSKRPASIAEIRQELQNLSAQPIAPASSSSPYHGFLPAVPQPAAPHVVRASSMGRLVARYSKHTDKIRSIAWSPDGKYIASGSNDSTVQIWEALTGTCIHVCYGHDGWVKSVAWSPDGSRVVSGCSGKTARIWDVQTGKQLFVYTGHAGLFGASVNAVAWSPDGDYIVSASLNKGIHVWKADTGERQVAYRKHTGGIWTVGWSPDGNSIASGGYTVSAVDPPVHIWEALSGHVIQTPPGNYEGEVHSLAWSPDGTRIVSVGSGPVQSLVWGINRDIYCSYGEHLGPILTVAWSPDGTRVVSGGFDATVRIWDAANARTIYTYAGHVATGWTTRPDVQAVAWSSDGKYIASGGSDDTAIHVWEAE